MANTLTQIGIGTGNIVEASHISQSIDAFTGAKAYDISLSGSFNMTGSIKGQPGIINPLTASYATTSLTSSLALRASGSLTGSLLGTASFATTSLTSSLALRASGSLTGSLLGTATTASYVLQAVSSSYALSASYTPNYLPLTGGTINGNITTIANFAVSASLITSGSRVRNYRTITVSTYSSSPTTTILPTDDIILVIDNTTTGSTVGQGNINITSFLDSSPAGRCVEIVKVKDGTGTGIILKYTVAGGFKINNTDNILGTSIICNTEGSSITLMSMGSPGTGSAWGTGI